MVIEAPYSIERLLNQPRLSVEIAGKTVYLPETVVTRKPEPVGDYKKRTDLWVEKYPQVKYHEAINILVFMREIMDMHSQGVSQYIESHYDFNNRFVYADMGIGTGHVTVDQAKKFPSIIIVGLDLSPGLLEQAKMNIYNANPEAIDNFIPIVDDLVHPPTILPDESIDSMNNEWVLQYQRSLERRTKMFPEWARLLKDGGQINVLTFDRKETNLPAFMKRRAMSGKESPEAISFFFKELGGLAREIEEMQNLGLMEFPDREQLVEEFKYAGLKVAEIIDINDPDNSDERIAGIYKVTKGKLRRFFQVAV